MQYAFLSCTFFANEKSCAKHN